MDGIRKQITGQYPTESTSKFRDSKFRLPANITWELKKKKKLNAEAFRFEVLM